MLFVVVLLVIIFRSLTLAIVTVLPPALSVTIAGPLVAEAAKHGLQVSPIAQLLLIVLVIGAGTDYGLFLVFRVREELRARDHGTSGENFPGRARLGAACSPTSCIRGSRPRRHRHVCHQGGRVDQRVRRHGDCRGADAPAGQLLLLL